MAWHVLTMVCDDHENGNLWQDKAHGISVFEDTQQDEPRYYAWRGAWEDHDTATHYPGDTALDAARAAEGGESQASTGGDTAASSPAPPTRSAPSPSQG